MAQGRILVVEDDTDTAEMLRLVFTEENFSVEVTNRGNQALAYTRKNMPDLIILDIILPGMDGYSVCRELRTTTRTSHIPIIFLTQKDDRVDRLAGLQLGADDYITKPFDIDELALRAKNAIQSHQRMNMTDPRSGLPASRLIEDQLRKLMQMEDWAYLEIAINYLQPFIDNYGFVAGDEVIRYIALLMNECVSELGTSDDFIGHAGNSIFTLITFTDEPEKIARGIRKRFDQEIATHYNFMDSEQGGIRLANGSMSPLMQLSIGLVEQKDQKISDIRELTELASELRRRDQA